MKIFVVSYRAPASLTDSYLNAMESLGIEFDIFNVSAAALNFAQLGRFGRKVHEFLPVQAWTKKGNRELAVAAFKAKPDIVMVFGNMRVNVGVLAYLKAATGCKVVWVWPDTLLNLEQWVLQCAGVIDYFASYSSTSMSVLHEIGYPRVEFVPLAADKKVHYRPATTEEQHFTADLSFVGGCRPERERALAAIVDAFPQLNVKIYGPTADWKRHCKNPQVLAKIAGGGLYGQAFSEVIATSRINLNVIDDTNYPAANMRFFEIPVAGGLQLVSPCPEMHDLYRHREHLLYFNNPDEMLENVRWAIDNPDATAKIRAQGQALTLASNTYEHRLQSIIDSLVKQ